MAILISCSQPNQGKPDFDSTTSIRYELISLEKKWLEAEFALDTVYLSTLLDSSFIDISANRTSNKQEELNDVYNNISAM